MGSTPGATNTTPTTAAMPGTVVVKVATVSLTGQSTAILTDAQGKTLGAALLRMEIELSERELEEGS